MVYSVPDEAIAAMGETHGDDQYVVTAFYGSDTTIPNTDYPDGVPITSQGSLTFDASNSDVQANGALYLADTGRSLVPKAFTDPLAPYGQELSIVRRVKYANAHWDIPLGMFRIQDVPDMSELYPGWPSQQALFGWQAQLTVCDRFDILKADDFLATTTPYPENSTWDEIRRLSNIPVVESLSDATVPASLVYQGRLDALTQLAANLGGELALTREGALTVRPANNWLTATETVATVKGTVTVSGGMSNEIINSVSVTNPNDPKILAVAAITDESNPLCVTGPLGRRTQTLSDPLMDTQAKADAGARTSLARLSSQQSRTVTVTCLPRPDLDLGDFIEVDDQASPNVYRGEVSRMEHQLDVTALMTLGLLVAEVTS